MDHTHNVASSTAAAATERQLVLEIETGSASYARVIGL